MWRQHKPRFYRTPFPARRLPCPHPLQHPPALCKASRRLPAHEHSRPVRSRVETGGQGVRCVTHFFGCSVPTTVQSRGCYIVGSLTVHAVWTIGLALAVSKPATSTFGGGSSKRKVNMPHGIKARQTFSRSSSLGVWGTATHHLLQYHQCFSPPPPLLRVDSPTKRLPLLAPRESALPPVPCSPAHPRGPQEAPQIVRSPASPLSPRVHRPPQHPRPRCLRVAGGKRRTTVNRLTVRHSQWESFARFICGI